jgi:hypothetical protein
MPTDDLMLIAIVLIVLPSLFWLAAKAEQWLARWLH